MTIKLAVTILKEFYAAYSCGFSVASDVISCVKFVIYGLKKVSLLFASPVLENLLVKYENPSLFLVMACTKFFI
jgi:hypothetical protein